MPPKLSSAVRQNAAALNMARAFNQHALSLKSSRRLGSGESNDSPDVEMLERLSELADNTAHVLHSLLNGCRMINRLPSELLATIFYFVPRAYSLPTPLTTFHTHALIDVVDLLPITSTCQHWREVALNTPLLWSSVIDANPGGIPLYTRYLHRCSHGPLSIYFSQVPSPTSLALLSEHSLRIQEVFLFHIAGASTHLESIALPSLRTFIYSGSASHSPVMPSFPGGCPRLNSLSLTCITLRPSVGFASLVRLHIENPECSSYSLGDLLGFLSGCYSLRNLYLVGIGASSITLSDTGQGLLVVLHHLERLALMENNLDGGQQARLRQMDFYQSFLSRLSIPDSCVMRFGEILPFQISRCIAIAGLTGSPTYWRVHHDDNDLYARDPNIHCIQVFNALQGRYVWLDVRASPGDGEASFSNDTVHLSAALSQTSVFANTHEVWTESSAEWLWNTGPKNVLLSHMTQLESLVICRDHVQTVGLAESGILNALEIKPGEDADIACPQLSTLRVDCTSDDDAVCALQLAASRAAAGHPLVRIVLVRAWGKMRWGMVHVYDSSGEVIKVGNMRADGLWDHWMAQLSPICRDESEDCEPYWRSWRWDPASPESMKWCQPGMSM